MNIFSMIRRVHSTWLSSSFIMGRSGKKRKKMLQAAGKNSKNPRTEDVERTASREFIKENDVFESYYKAQGIVPVNEWDNFLSSLRSNLPVTFRITGTRLMVESVLACLDRRYLHELSSLEIEGEKVEFHPLQWYPDRLAWYFSVSRPVVRKSPLLSKFHSFLVRENEQGNISRQEAVSMIPPLLLNVEPGHNVLDMCAAPGSKTAQLIEALHTGDNPIPDGVIIANDADNKRCYTLVHQAKRLNTPCFMVTNHDASAFPDLFHHDENDVRHTLHYDRILCDVPCSGDGTLRKNPTIWKTWNPGQSVSLHKLQLRILIRGLELLSPGGRLVYSTCSMNPIEDEAVIHTALRLSQGSVSLVDCSDKLKGLVRANGLSDWKVMSKSGGDWLSSPSDTDSVPSSCFPPSPADSAQYHLDRCLRVLPHFQDTGGFFVAVFQKNTWLPWQLEAKSSTPASTEGAESATETAQTGSTYVKRPDDIIGKPGYSKKSRYGYKEDPIVYLKKDDPAILNFSSFYGLPESFPCQQLMTRTHSDKKKTLYLTSRLVKELTIRNEKRCKIVNTGVRVLSRSEHPHAVCKYRLTQEGLETMSHFVTSKNISCELDDVVRILSEPNPLTTTLSAKVQKALESLKFCPALFTYKPDPEQDQGTSAAPYFLLSGWIAPKSVRLFVPAAERCHFLSMLGIDPPNEMSLETEGVGRKRTREKMDEELNDDDDDDECDNDSDSSFSTDKDQATSNTNTTTTTTTTDITTAATTTAMTTDITTVATTMDTGCEIDDDSCETTVK